MRVYDFNKSKPKNDRTILILVKDYNWGEGCQLKTEIARMINGECVLSPVELDIKMPLDRIVKWSYIN